MSNVFNYFLRNVLNLEPQEKVNLAQGALGEFISGLKKAGRSDEEISSAIMNLTKLFISADRKFTADEYSFFRAVTGIDVDPETFYNLTNGGAAQDFVEASFAFFRSLDKETRDAGFMYGVAVMSCDDNIDFSESDLIKEIISLSMEEDEK